MTREEARAVLRDCTKRWFPLLDTAGWDVSVHYHESTAAFHQVNTDTSWDALACTSTSWAYMRADVHFDLERCATEEPAMLEDVWCHELMHMYVHEMRALTQCECAVDFRHEERVCTQLGRLMCGLLRQVAPMPTKGVADAQACSAEESGGQDEERQR